MTEQKSTPRTWWHRLLGALLKELLTPLGITVQPDFPVMSKTPEGDILLLRREGDRWTEEQRQFLPDGVRDSLAEHNILEFKYTESLNEDAIVQSLGYDHFYRRSNELPRKNVATFILSSKTPNKLIMEEGGYELSGHKGVYRSKRIVFRLVTILVLNELSPEPHNAFVKCFASRKKEKKKAYQVIYETFYKKLSLNLQLLITGLAKVMGQKDWEDDEMNLEVTPEDVIKFGEKVGEAYLSSLKPEERLAGLQPEERLAGLQPQERLAGLQPQERLAGLKPQDVLNNYKPEERLAGLQLEEIETYLQKIKMQKLAESTTSDVEETKQTPSISKEKAIEIAKAICQEQHWKWEEPIKITLTETYWLIEFDNTVEGTKINIQIDKTSGQVINQASK